MHELTRARVIITWQSQHNTIGIGGTNVPEQRSLNESLLVQYHTKSVGVIQLCWTEVSVNNKK